MLRKGGQKRSPAEEGSLAGCWLRALFGALHGTSLQISHSLDFYSDVNGISAKRKDSFPRSNSKAEIAC